MFGGKPFLTFTEWARTYGDLFSLRLGTQDAIVINSIEVAREALVTKGKHFAGRPDFYTSKYIDINIIIYALIIYYTDSCSLIDRWSDLRRNIHSLSNVSAVVIIKSLISCTWMQRLAVLKLCLTPKYMYISVTTCTCIYCSSIMLDTCTLELSEHSSFSEMCVVFVG